VLPIGAFEPDTISCVADTVPQAPRAGESFLAITTADGAWEYFKPRWPVAHAARFAAALIADANCVSWRPLSSRPDVANALETAGWLRRQYGDGYQLMRRAGRSSGAIRRREVVVVSGPTGSGKSTVGAFLARQLNAQPLEVGVIVRLLGLHLPRKSDRELAQTLWQWSRRGRLDFDGASSRGLAAGLPRLDGRVAETPMWVEVDPQALSEIAKGKALHEVTEEVIAAASEQGAIVIRRPAVGFLAAETHHVQLEAAPSVRAQRKLAQLGVLQMTSIHHDWFSPHLEAVAAIDGPKIDTTRLSIPQMCGAALESLSSSRELVAVPVL
jgi:cytidylate kinase